MSDRSFEHRDSRGLSAGQRLAAAWRGGPLANRDFKLLSLGQLTSTVGDFCYAVALPWFILSSHGGTVLLGIVLACYGIPRTILIPVGGILADKFGPRPIMLTADAIRCVLVAALAVLAARHTTSLAVLGPVAVLLGAGEGAFIPASYSIMPGILAPEQLAAGNSISTAMIQVGTLAGPVLGGVLVATAGSSPAFAVDAATFAVSAGSLLLLRTRRSAAALEETADVAPGLADAAPGLAGAAPGPAEAEPERAAGPTSVWSLLRQSRLLQVIVAVCVVANLTSGGTFEVALPALAHANYGPSGYGALVACIGAGALIGTLAAVRANSLRRPAVAAFSAFLVESVVVSFIPFLGGIAGAAAAILVFGMCNGFGNIVCLTLIQQWAPKQMLGRVISLVMLAGIGSFPASVAVAGVLVRHLGPAPFFPASGVVLAVTLLFGLSQREIRDFGATDPGATTLSPESA